MFDLARKLKTKVLVTKQKVLVIETYHLCFLRITNLSRIKAKIICEEIKDLEDLRQIEIVDSQKGGVEMYLYLREQHSTNVASQCKVKVAQKVKEKIKPTCIPCVVLGSKNLRFVRI